MSESEECPRCSKETFCCDIDEITGVCTGRCDKNGIHPEDQQPISGPVDAMSVAKWIFGCWRSIPNSHTWYDVRRADQMGIGLLIDCMRQMENK